MKFATAVVLALVGAVSAKSHGQCGSGKHRHHTATKAKASGTLSEILNPTSIASKATSVAVSSSAIVTGSATASVVSSSASEASSDIPTAIINVAPPPGAYHSFSHASPSSQSRSTVLVTSTVTASIATSTAVHTTSTATHTSTSVAAPTSHTTTSSVIVPTSTKASSTSTTSSAVKTSTTSSKVPVPTSGANSKRGVGFNVASDTLPFAGSIGWLYNWGSSISGTVPPGVEYVPMLWSDDEDHTSHWDADVEKALNSGSKYLLGFNEPDLGSQSNIKPADAAAAWKKWMEPYAGKAMLVSPAVTNGDPAQGYGTGWLDAFFAECTGCTFDAIAIHIYDSATNEGYFKSYIPGVAAKYNKPVWVTEFGGSGTDAQQETFLKDMVTFLDGQSGIERFAAEGAFQGQFVSGTQLTPVGAAYANA